MEALVGFVTFPFIAQCLNHLITTANETLTTLKRTNELANNVSLVHLYAHVQNKAAFKCSYKINVPNIMTYRVTEKSTSHEISANQTQLKSTHLIGVF